MDDMDFMAQTVAGGQDLLSRSMVALSWARMENRADKSRSIVRLCPYFMSILRVSLKKGGKALLLGSVFPVRCQTSFFKNIMT